MNKKVWNYEDDYWVIHRSIPDHQMTPRSLGYNEEGSSVGAPIFRQFMKDAFKRQPVIPFRVPSDIRLIRVNAETGLPAKPEDKNIILEAFLPGFGPINELLVLDGLNGFLKSNGKVKRGTGGLY